MKIWLTSGLFIMLLVLTGCGSAPSVSGSTAPLTEEEKRLIAEQDQRIDEEESPNNKTRKMKPRGR
jgi:hypothetical protein